MSYEAGLNHSFHHEICIYANQVHVKMIFLESLSCQPQDSSQRKYDLHNEPPIYQAFHQNVLGDFSVVEITLNLHLISLPDNILNSTIYIKQEKMDLNRLFTCPSVYLAPHVNVCRLEVI